jgi:hypothetical protein
MSNHTLHRPARRGIHAIAAAICSGAVAATLFTSLGAVASITSTAAAPAALSVASTAAAPAIPPDPSTGDPWG